MKPIAILVVDDDEPTLRILQRWLESQGHRVVCAKSGHEAQKSIADRPVELVITDVLMPDGNGLDLISGLKRDYPAVRILAISGGGAHTTSSSCLVRAHHSGAHALLLKPFKPDQLQEAMRYVMGVPESDPAEQAPIANRGRAATRTRLTAVEAPRGTVRSREVE